MKQIGNETKGNRIEVEKPATQQPLRSDKACLGGHDAGVSGIEEGVENTSLPITKRGRLRLSDCPTFSGFVGVEKDF